MSTKKSALKQLQAQGFPTGLAVSVWDCVANITPYRIWVVDNSGSMKCNDGSMIRADPFKDEVLQVTCTRWAELCATVEYHSSLAGALQMNSTFRLLNDPSDPNSDQIFAIGEDLTSIQQDVHKAQAIMRMSQPNGVTPLTSHILEIYYRISLVRDELKERGQVFVVVLATDGLPSDSYGNSTKEVVKEFLGALRELQELPVWIVVRLCTSDEKVCEFYDKLDLNLETPVDVLNDLFQEAQQVYEHNKWLNYAMPLHRCREMGFRHPLLDLLDERSFNKDEVKDFIGLILGKSKLEDSPDPHLDWKGFIKFITDLLKMEGKQWNPISRKMEPWILIRKLQNSFKLRESSFKQLFKKKSKGNILA